MIIIIMTLHPNHHHNPHVRVRVPQDLNIAEITKISVIDDGISTSDSSSKVRHFLERGPAGNFSEWVHLKPAQVFYTFHRGGVSHLSLSARTAQLATLSQEDAGVRVRGFNSAVGPDAVEESFGESEGERGKAEAPLCMQLHPSGFFLAIGTEDLLLEYAVSDSR